MIQKNFDTIQIEDFEELINNQIAEGKSLEYKAILKLEKDSDKKEFLYDITSFANAIGGDIIFGVPEGDEKGLPVSIEGIEGNVDELCRKIESLLRDCVSPRILNILMKSIPLNSGKNVLLIRIPKSFNAPHQVTFQGVDKFYSRSNNGKYVLDVFELRNVFLQSSQIIDRIRNFIKTRLASIVANDTPVPLESNPKIVLHIVPIQSIENRNNIITNQDLKSNMLFPLGAGGYNYRFNLEGVLNFCSSPGQTKNQAFVQLYRNGIIETVNADLLREYDTKRLIYVDKNFSIEEKIITFLDNALKLLQKVGVQTPIYLFLHLVNVKGYGLGSTRLRQPFYGERGIDRDLLQLPEIVLQNYPINVASILKDWFEPIWNACGFEKCLSYDENGNFTGF
jgi:predicted HTH transcriptional regulator